ncbi:VirE2 family protein [Bradyrhizobium sp. Arg314]
MSGKDDINRTSRERSSGESSNEGDIGTGSRPSGQHYVSMDEDGSDNNTSSIETIMREQKLADRMERHRNKPPAKLPNDDSLLVAIRDPVDEDRNPHGTRWTFLRGADFQRQHGPKTPEDVDRELVYIKYNGNYHTKSGLWNAIKDPLSDETTLEYKDREFRRIAVRLGITAERTRDLYPSGTKIVTDERGKKTEKPNYALKGQDQFYNTPAGPRRRAVAYRDSHVNGELAPDCMVHMHDGTIRGFSRLPEDGFEGVSLEALEKERGKLWLKSLHHVYQTPDYIDRTQGKGAALNRFADYAGENRAHNKNTDTAYVKIHDTYFPVKEVLNTYPDDIVSKAIKRGPTLDERMLIRMPTGNTFVSPNWAYEMHPDYFKAVCEDHGINPEWGKFKPKWHDRLNKYALHSRVLIEEDGNLVEEASVMPENKAVLDEYPPERIFYEGDTKNGDRTGTFTSLAETHRQATSERNDGKDLSIPDEVTDILVLSRERRESTSMSQPPPRYDERSERRQRRDSYER